MKKFVLMRIDPKTGETMFRQRKSGIWGPEIATAMRFSATKAYEIEFAPHKGTGTTPAGPWKYKDCGLLVVGESFVPVD